MGALLHRIRLTIERMPFHPCRWNRHIHPLLGLHSSGRSPLIHQDHIQLERSSARSDPDRERELSHPPHPPEKWDAYLSRHPNSVFADFIRYGMRAGFRIGTVPVSRASQSCPPSRRNHRSVHEHPEEVTRYIQAEILAGRLQPPPPDAITHTSPIGIIPKSRQPGKWRLITNLSSPRGNSVNNTIDPLLCSLKYTAIWFLRAGEFVACCPSGSSGALIAASDITRDPSKFVQIHLRQSKTYPFGRGVDIFLGR